jgi:hypothetical protein
VLLDCKEATHTASNALFRARADASDLALSSTSDTDLTLNRFAVSLVASALVGLNMANAVLIQIDASQLTVASALGPLIGLSLGPCPRPWPRLPLAIVPLFAGYLGFGKGARWWMTVDKINRPGLGSRSRHLP